MAMLMGCSASLRGALIRWCSLTSMGTVWGYFWLKWLPTTPNDNIVIVLDGAGWHRRQSMSIPTNIALMFLPPNSPELNLVEHIWDELREKHFHNRAFDSLDALEDQLVAGLSTLEQNLKLIQSICSQE